MIYKNILVTGSAGFIGFHLCKDLLLDNSVKIVGVDNLNDYYNPLLKEKRLEILRKHNNFEFHKLDFSDNHLLIKTLNGKKIDLIVHLGAQAGVRYSLTNPHIYERSNLLGTMNIFEFARNNGIKKVVYASSSSVYGANTKIPFSESDAVDNPVSLYAATKKANELMAYTYHHLYGIDMIGLRFFTVYGEYGRPDMALWKFTKNILLDKEIEVFNYGEMERDFTYCGDIVAGIKSAIDCDYNCEVFNLGNSNPVKLGYFIGLLEKHLGKKAKKKMLPMQDGDVLKTYADLAKSETMLGFKPKVKIEDGLKRFAEWFVENKDWTLNI